MPFTDEFATEIARKHGFKAQLTRMPDSGMVNEVWLIGDAHVLRIIAVDDADDEATREGFVVPLVRKAGVRSPELLVCKPGREDGDPPYTIYERAKGDLLGHLTDDQINYEPVYREIGREIYFLNQIEIGPEMIPKLRKGSSFDAAKQLAQAIEKEVISAGDASSVKQMIERLASLMGEPMPPRFLHQDIHPWNLFVEPATKELTAIIDWGDTSWGDPAGEFSSMPLIAVEPMLQGYVSAGGTVNESFVARSLSLGLALALWECRELDPKRFERQWWRFRAEGWNETLRIIESVVVNYSR